MGDVEYDSVLSAEVGRCLVRFQRGDWLLGNGNSASEPPIAHRQSLIPYLEMH
jgi:hypothetical protein